MGEFIDFRKYNKKIKKFINDWFEFDEVIEFLRITQKTISIEIEGIEGSNCFYKIFYEKEKIKFVSKEELKAEWVKDFKLEILKLLESFGYDFEAKPLKLF